jgi:hypothetical protein
MNLSAITIVWTGAVWQRLIAGGPRFVGRSLCGCAALLAFWCGVTETPKGLALEPQATATKAAERQRKAPEAAKPAKHGTKSVVPFEMLVSNHMLVEARINDKGPFHLIFDLGAPITLLNNRASEAAGVVKPDTPRSFLFGMRGEAVVNQLKVGELTAENLPVIILDHPVLKALEDVTRRPVDGIMGFTFFARFKTTIDYHAHEMTFEPIAFEVRDLMKELPDRLLGPKVSKRTVVAPAGLWGMQLGEPAGGLDMQGVPIAKVLDGSPANIAGLRSGDVLCTIDDRWITSVADVYHAAAKVPSGRKITVLFKRDGKEMTLSITPSEGI